MNNRRTLFVLVGLFIVLLIISVVQSNRVTAPNNINGATLAPGEAALKNPNRIFKDFEASDIQAFGVLDPDTRLTFTLARDGDGWSSLEFGSEGLDNRTAESMALTVAILPYLDILTDVKPDNYSQFGLTDASAYLLISIVLKDKTQHGIIIGNVLPDNSGHYALVDDRSEVYALDAHAVAFLVSYLRQIYLPMTATPAATATSGQ